MFTFNQPIPIKPITTEAESMLDPRPASGPYNPYDFSQMGVIDIVAYTIQTGGTYMLAGCLFFFFVQFAAHYVLGAIFGDAYKKRRTPTQQREDCIRVCAIVNGLTSISAAFLFFRSFILHGFRLHSYHYQPMAGYDFNRGFITGYFIWDIIICIRYQWGFLWTVHGIFSFLGSFFLNFPVSDHIGTFFSGTFELTNGLMHSSVLLRNYGVGLHIATIFEYIFALLYFIIRVIGGTYCAYTWISDMLILWGRGEVHNYPATAFLIFSLSTIILLQYVWFWEIVQIGLGLKKNDHTSTDDAAVADKKAEASIVTTEAKTTATQRKSVRKEE